MSSNVQKGYMLLADISGYTSFMESTEIEHSANILNNIIQLIIEQLSPVMTIAEVEGDAVFAYAPESSITRGELLLELIETTYAAYRDRQATMRHNSSCGCQACQSIATLDLKFITHHGEYILQNLTGRPKPVGTSVNLVHRLLKNTVNQSTGWRGYALFSKTALDNMAILPTGMRKAHESVEGLGTIETGSIDLNEGYRQLVKSRKIRIEESDADVSVAHSFDMPQPVVWDWMTDPHKRNLWFEGTQLSIRQKPDGRTGPTVQYHCAISDAIEEILDWRPFEYYTVRLSKGRFRLLITVEFQQKSGQTDIRWNMKHDSGLPAWMGRPLTRLVARKKFKLSDNFNRMAKMMAEPRPEETV